MILRKPYAFFIRHFKLIHLLMAVFSFYLIYRIKQLVDFFNEYSSEVINVIGQDLITPLMPGLFQFVPILIILLSVIVLIVMIVKQKPYIFYILLIILNIYTFVIVQLSKSTLNTLSLSLIDSRTLLLVRDLVTISFIFQLICLIIVFIRGVGFDLKKFDFENELKTLEIDDKDNEEVEVELKFDGNKKLRKLRKFIRFTKYFYKENRLVINCVSSAFVLVSLTAIIIMVSNGDKIIKQNEYFYGNNFTLVLTDSYLVNTDYKGKKLTDDYYLLLRMKIKNNTKKTIGLDLATTKILIGNYVYTPIIENRESFFDFGDIYEGENISNETEEKVLLYKIPKQLIKEKIVFSFVDKTNIDNKGNFDSTKVEIKYNDLVGIDSQTTATLSNNLEFTDSILPDYKIRIDAFDLKSQYKLSYDFCVSDECFKSYEYIKPSINTNYSKTILKIQGSLEYEKNLDGIYDLYDFIEKFGVIKYTIDGEEKIQQINFVELKSQRLKENNIYYIEVLKEIENASNISLIFTVRNKNYEYILK